MIWQSPLWQFGLYPVLNMSLTAGIIILLVLVMRLALRRAPRIFSYILWAVVLFRLLCPFSLQAPLSLLGWLDAPISQSTGTAAYIPDDLVAMQDPQVDLIIPAVSHSVSQLLPAPQQLSSVNPLQIYTWIAAVIWLIGIGIMLLWGLLACIRLHRQLIGSVRLRDNIYMTDHIPSPFVLGIFRPRIYLPSDLSEREQPYILVHEQHHIHRLDHISQILAFLALCLHWFNPLVWIAYILSRQDMETSCDEAVIRQMGSQVRAEYSASLLSFATGHHRLSPAFGEGDPKGRIRNLARWQQPRRWVSIVAALLCILFMAACAFNPGTETIREGNRYACSSFIGERAVLSSIAADPDYYKEIILDDAKLTVRTSSGETLYSGDSCAIRSFVRNDLLAHMEGLALYTDIRIDIESLVPQYENMLVYRYFEPDNPGNIMFSIYYFDGVPTWFVQGEDLRFYELAAVSLVGGADDPQILSVIIFPVEADTWPENEYTAGLPAQQGGSVNQGWINKQQGYCFIQMIHVSQQQYEAYVEQLMDNYGFRLVAAQSNNVYDADYTGHNTLLTNGEKNISFSYSSGNLAIAISHNE